MIEVQDFGMKISSRKSTMKKKKLENLEHSDKVPTTPPPKPNQVVPTTKKLPNLKPEVSSANPKEHGRRKYLNQNLEIDAATPKSKKNLWRRPYNPTKPGKKSIFFYKCTVKKTVLD